MDWQKEDLKYIWHPCSQMKDYDVVSSEVDTSKVLDITNIIIYFFQIFNMLF